MEFRCKNCGHKDEIKFGVVGHGLIDLTVNFRCRECGCAGILYVEFRKDKDNAVTVTIEKPDYFG